MIHNALLPTGYAAEPFFTVLCQKLQINEIINKLASVFLCVCPVIDHEFRHHIVKVAVDPRGDSRVDPQTTLTML